MRTVSGVTTRRPFVASSSQPYGRDASAISTVTWYSVACGVAYIRICICQSKLPTDDAPELRSVCTLSRSHTARLMPA